MLIPPPRLAAANGDNSPIAWPPLAFEGPPALSGVPATSDPSSWLPEPRAIPPDEPLPVPAAGSFSPDIASGIADDSDALRAQPSWYRPNYWLGPEPWDTGIELGLNGSSGSNESFSVRTGGYIKRESRFSKLDLTTNYNRTTTGGLATQNNAQLDVRNDWLLDDTSPWTLYGTGNVFYDEFQAFDLQVSANTGIGYRFVHEAGLNLVGRFGAGTSREIGGPADRWVPESLIGFEFSQQLSATQKFYGKLDYYPEWEELGEYRLIADSGWEIALVHPSNLSLKVSATDRYDSTPNGAEPHLLNYSVLLLLRL